MVAAFLAALAWVKAARAPIPFLTVPDASDSQGVQAALKSYMGFENGMKWNARAAYLSAIAAFATGISWLLQLL